MFFILSKLLDFLINPLLWVLLLLFLGLNLKSKRWRKIFWIWGIGLGILFSNHFFANLAMLAWEIPPTPLDQIEQSYEVGVVLTGVTLSRKSPKDRTYFKQGADRITHALMLYRKGIVRKILITGGTISVTGQREVSEAYRLKQFLVDAQVPVKDIILDETARNTRENALRSRDILQRDFPKARVLLITSAFHLRRARACFYKVGLRPDTFSAGFLSLDWNRLGLGAWLPSGLALHYWHVLIHEWLGYLMYALVGFL